MAMSGKVSARKSPKDFGGLSVDVCSGEHSLGLALNDTSPSATQEFKSELYASLERLVSAVDDGHFFRDFTTHMWKYFSQNFEIRSHSKPAASN
jgi:hypothetical protein